MVLNKSFQYFELFTKALVKNNFLLNSGIGSNYYNPLTNDIISLHLPQNHHLKLGRGWAWAGHISANWDAALVLNVEDSDFELNCGLVPPIGSNKNIGIFDTPYLSVILDWMQVRKGSITQESHLKIFTLHCKLPKTIYLYEGSRNAWAGQSRANEPPKFFSKVPINFESDETLGNCFVKN